MNKIIKVVKILNMKLTMKGEIKMKLSKETLTVLNNFSNINANILIKEGNNIRTRSESNSIYSEANLTDRFPMDFGISDLHNFLNTYNIFNEPELTFSDEKVNIKEGNAEYDYHRASERVLTFPPYDKNIVLKDYKSKFQIDKDQFKNIIKAANAIKNISSNKDSIIRFYCNNSDIIVEAKLSKDEPMKNVFRINLGSDYEIVSSFDVSVNSSKFNLIDGDYEIEIYERFIKLRHSQLDLFYVLACEIL